MIGHVGESHRAERLALRLQRVVELLPQSHVEPTVDEVVRLVDADLITRLLEVPCLQIVDDDGWPVPHLGVEKLGRPPSPCEGAPSGCVHQPGIVEGLAAVCQRLRRVCHPRPTHIGCAAHERQVLPVFG